MTVHVFLTVGTLILSNLYFRINVLFMSIKICMRHNSRNEKDQIYNKERIKIPQLNNSRLVLS